MHTKENMKRSTKKPEKAPVEPKAIADQTLQIEWPWRMTWMEYEDEMLAFLKTQVGPGHPLHRKKMYVSAVNKDADAWYVEGEKEDFYAIVYFGRKKRYGSRMMPECEILADWDAVLQRFAADHAKAMSSLWSAPPTTRPSGPLLVFLDRLDRHQNSTPNPVCWRVALAQHQQDRDVVEVPPGGELPGRKEFLVGRPCGLGEPVPRLRLHGGGHCLYHLVQVSSSQVLNAMARASFMPSTISLLPTI